MKKDIEELKEEFYKTVDRIEKTAMETGEEFKYIHIDYVKNLINQLDELEVLSPEWIDGHKMYCLHSIQNGYFIPEELLKNLLVPKQELPSVNREDAKNIVKYKSKGWTLSHLLNDIGIDAGHDEWLARAWIAYPNITVEEEQKYYALIKGHEHIQGEEKYWNYDKENENLEVGKNKVQDDVLTDYTIQATLREWEDLGINEDNAKFVKVEELE